MSNTTIDHDEIRSWAESKGGKPAAVDRTHHDGDVGIIRLMFPDNKQSEHSALVEITWDEFFEQFEDGQLALIYDEKSLFNKLIGRDTAEKREHGEHASRHHSARETSDKKDTAAKSQASHKSEASPKSDESRKGKSSSGHETYAESKGGDDLKSREYKDADGTVHHHTRAYEKQHGSK